MSERVYNDRLLMKLRQQEEEEKRKMLESPLEFDFGDKFGNTSHLYDFQSLISKTSKNIKDLSFDSEYKDYDYQFKEGERQKYSEEQGRVIITPSNDDGTSDSKATKQSRVKFGDVTDLESEHYEGRLSREKKRATRAARKSGDLDMNDIDVDFSPDALDDLLGEGEGSNFSDLLGVKSLQGSRSRKSKQSKQANKMKQDGSQVFSLDDMSSYFSDRTVSDEDEDGDLEQRELDDGVSELGGAHNKKYCKHSPTGSLKKRSEDYYKKLPRLLKTSELRNKAAANGKTKEKPRESTGPYVNHECMVPYKTAYERALALVRGRSLPQKPDDLYNRTTRITFSYMPGMPGTEGITFKTKSGGTKHVSTRTPAPGAKGLKGILGNVDMNDFYREEDELIYYVKSEEINTVVESSVDTTESRNDAESDVDDDYDDGTYEDSSEAITRATSGAFTTKTKSSFDTDNESVN